MEACCEIKPIKYLVLFSAVHQSPALLPDPGELGLGAGGAVRLAPRHRAVGQLQSHGERDEVSIDRVS